MKDLILKVLKEQTEENLKVSLDSIVEEVRKKFPNFILTYSISNNRINFLVDTVDDSSNGTLFNSIRYFIWDKSKLFPNYILSINPKQSLLNKFYNTPYMREFIPFLKQHNLNPKNYFLDYDGKKNPFLQDTVDEIKKVESFKSFYNEIPKLLQSLTDVPLEVYVTPQPTTIFIKILPQLTFDDFMNCKYKEWFPDPNFNSDNSLEQQIIELANKYNVKNKWGDNISVKYEIVWPRDISSFIVDQNEKLRDSFYENFEKISPYEIGFTSIAIDYGPCVNNSFFLIGLGNSGSLYQYRNKRAKINKFLQSKYPNTPEILTTHNAFNVSKLYDSQNKQYWNKDKLFNFFVGQSKKVFGDIYTYNIEEFDDLESLTQVYCKKHQRYFEVIPNEHIGGKRCPLDKESKGEASVRVYLEQNKIPFLQYHKLKGCFSEINGKCILLTFDFYLPENNTIIEYDGEQHFRPVERFGGEPTYQRQVILDNIKNVFAKNSNIKLIRIPYTVKKPQDIKSILDSELS